MKSIGGVNSEHPIRPEARHVTSRLQPFCGFPTMGPLYSWPHALFKPWTGAEKGIWFRTVRGGKIHRVHVLLGHGTTFERMPPINYGRAWQWIRKDIRIRLYSRGECNWRNKTFLTIYICNHDVDHYQHHGPEHSSVFLHGLHHDVGRQICPNIKFLAAVSR